MCDDDDLSTYNDDTVHNMWVDNSYYMNTGEQPYLNNPKSQPQTRVNGPAADSASNGCSMIACMIIVLAVIVAAILLMFN